MIDHLRRSRRKVDGNILLQQQEDKFKYTCGDCDFESDCVHCFSDHDHDQDEEQDMQVPNFKCYYCDEVFRTKATVMTHTKVSHTTKVKPCHNYLEGTCSYHDRCWFYMTRNLRSQLQHLPAIIVMKASEQKPN